MSKNIVRLFVALALSAACLPGMSAQEEVAPAKKPLPKAQQDAKAKAQSKRVKARAKAEAEARAKAVDLNRASKEALMKLPGITPALADAIVAHRPYHSKADLVTKNIIPMGTYQSLRKLVAAK
jgi:competence protein ComEA